MTARLATASIAMVVLVSMATIGVGADTYPRQPGIDVEHYLFRLELSDQRADITGDATVSMRFLQANVAAVVLDLATPAAGKGMTVESVSMSTGAVSFRHVNNQLTLALPAPPPAGARREFAIRYRGVPANGLRLIPNKYGDWSAFSENWPNRAREWLPMVDHPHEKATSEFIVTAPSKYQVVANGLLQEEFDLGDGRRRTHWKQSVPIASWLNAIGVQQFAVRYSGRVKDVELSTWVTYQDRDVGPLYFDEPARRALEFFSEFVGPYAYEKLANVAAAGISGGTEHASVIFYGEKGVRPSPGTNLVAHEIAHQWFGNAVTERDWDDVWLSEGFATYFTHLYVEHFAGRDAMVAGLRRDITTIAAEDKRLPGTPIVHRNLDDMSRVSNRLVYQKAGWALHMLRGMLGTERFRAAIRDYYARFLNGSASTSDVREAFERASGLELAWFFTQWFDRAGMPRLDGSWRYDPVAKRVQVTITQTAQGGVYRLPIEIGLVTAPGSAPAVTTVELAGALGAFVIPSEAAPVDVVLDPNTWLLFERGKFGPAAAR